MPRFPEGWRLADGSVCCSPGIGQAPKPFCLGQDRTGFYPASHPIENVRQQEILARLIRLARDRLSLCPACIFQPVGAYSYQGDEIQCRRLMHIKPAGVAESDRGFFRVARLGQETSHCHPGLVMPPVILGKWPDQIERRFQLIGFPQEFAFGEDQLPSMRDNHAAPFLKSRSRPRCHADDDEADKD